MRTLGLAGLMLVMSVGCSTGADPCAAGGSWPVTFLGGAYGRGDVSLERAADGGFGGRLRLTQTEGREGGDALVLEGRGVCRDGVVKLDFGGGATTDGKLRILGGTLTAVLPRPGFIDAPFGAWEAELTSAAWTEPRRIEGPWVHAPTPLAVDDVHAHVAGPAR